MSWVAQARCHRYDPEIFFDTRAKSQRQAKAICAQCEVRTNCLAFALQCRAEFGVWGGLNGKERRALLRSAPTSTDWRVELETVAATA